MKKIISMISIMIIIVSYISTVFATNIEVNSIIEDTVNEIVEDNEIIDTEVNEIVDNTTDDEVDNEKMTKEELENAIKKANKNINGEIIIEGDKIIISSQGEEYSMKYNLEGNPKFITRAIITEDMTMDEYSTESGNLLIGMLGFLIVSASKDIELENAMAYALLSLFNNIDLSDTDLRDMEMITENNFNAIELASKAYDKEKIIEDELYKMTVKKVSSTETECIIESTYEVKIDEDFSIVEEYNIEDIIPFNEIAENVQIAQNKFFEDRINEEIAINEMMEWVDKQNTIIENIIEIPQTGKTLDTEDILWIILIGSVGVFGLYCVYNKRKNGKE